MGFESRLLVCPKKILFVHESHPDTRKRSVSNLKLQSVCFSYFKHFGEQNPFCSFDYPLQQCFFTTPLKAHCHCTKRIFRGFSLYDKDFFALRLNKKDFQPLQLVYPILNYIENLSWYKLPMTIDF